MRELDRLAEIGKVGCGGTPEAVERVLAAAREILGMDAAFVSEFAGGDQVFRAVEGDAASFGLREGAGIPLKGTFCKRMVERTVPGVIPDARRDGRVSRLEITRNAGIGAYVGVPVRFSDGRLYGTMCLLSHSPDPSLGERDVGFVRVLARLVAEQLEREELVAEKLRLEAEAAALGALLAAIDARDGYSGDHCKSVLSLAAEVARRMGLSAEESRVVRQAALLHDVGKLAVPDTILKRPGPLDAQDWELMRRHPAEGARIVSSVPSLTHLAPVIRAAHERWDGTGYPDGLAGEEIPLASRIVFACDAWHAMSSDRPYRGALDAGSKVRELERGIGEQFDPRVALTLAGILRDRYLLPPDESERIVSEAIRRVSS